MLKKLIRWIAARNFCDCLIKQPGSGGQIFPFSQSMKADYFGLLGKFIVIS